MCILCDRTSERTQRFLVSENFSSRKIFSLLLSWKIWFKIPIEVYRVFLVISQKKKKKLKIVQIWCEIQIEEEFLFNWVRSEKNTFESQKRFGLIWLNSNSIQWIPREFHLHLSTGKTRSNRRNIRKISLDAIKSHEWNLMKEWKEEIQKTKWSVFLFSDSSVWIREQSEIDPTAKSLCSL